jgi:cobalt-zinc-cadmium efflux system outer membrane protein
MKPPILLSLLLALTPDAFSHAASNQLESLTLDGALALAERRQPQLAEARALIEAAAGRAQQAGAFPNPEAIVGAQQLPLESGASNQREYVAGVAQQIPLGARLAKAREAELREREVRVRVLEVMRRDLRKRVHSAFATALYQQQAFVTQNQVAQNIEKVVALTKARVDAGDVPPEYLARAEMELARTKVEVQRSRALREQSMIQLAAAIGDTRLTVDSVAGSLDATFELPTLESLVANLSAQPELQLSAAGQRASHARLALAKAERIPDVKAEVLYHRLQATKDNTIDLGLSMPLPLFNRHQGRWREARAEAAAAEARSRRTENELHLRLRESYAQLSSALGTARALQTEILPRAEAVLQSAESRYAAGDTSLTEVLVVRRDWAAIQLTRLEFLRDVMQAWTALSPYLEENARQ